jgi:predicted Zn finger-like uncharacterized protein
MKYGVSCPHCSAKLTMTDRHIGQTVRCPNCSILFPVTDVPPPLPAQTSRRSPFAKGIGFGCGCVVAGIVGFVALCILMVMLSNRGARESFMDGYTGKTASQREAEKRAIPKGKLLLERVWQENVGGYDCAYVIVKYTNDTGKSYHKAVTIQATALDKSGKAINVNSRSFFVHKVGTIKSGFVGRLRIPVELHGQIFDRMECIIREAR